MASVPSEPETPRFGHGDTELGSIAVLESARGVVAFFLGDDRPQMLRDLERAFPNAKLIPDEPGSAQTINQAVIMVNKPNATTDLPLDLRGSAVELAVWTALRAIPDGETRT
jgi:AraC family transcriptional regulator, regulatory protein of adaptative response / methylated-DNA-[protein]-cysteine methyltransferase